jgi:hypothetical protein
MSEEATIRKTKTGREVVIGGLPRHWTAAGRSSQSASMKRRGVQLSSGREKRPSVQELQRFYNERLKGDGAFFRSATGLGKTPARKVLRGERTLPVEKFESLITQTVLAEVEAKAGAEKIEEAHEEAGAIVRRILEQ